MSDNFTIKLSQRWLGKFGTEYEIVRVVRYDKPRWPYRVQYRAVNYPEYVYNAEALAFYNKHGIIAQ